MTIFSNLYNRLVRWRRPKPPPGMEERLSWLLQPYLHTVEDVLMWKNPTVSLAFFIFANIILWVLRTYNIRLLGIVGGSLLCAVILDALATALGERKAASGYGGARRGVGSTSGSSNRPALQLREVKHQVEATLRYVGGHLATMRNTNHAQFCALVCSGIVALWLVVWMGGGLLWHGLLSTALLWPLLPALEPDSRHPDSDGEVEGFLPELSALVLKELNAAGAGDHLREPAEYSSIMSDLSLPPDDALLRTPTGVASSGKEIDLSFSDHDSNVDSSISDDEWMGNLMPANSSDSSDSSSKFLIQDNRKQSYEKRSHAIGASSLAPTAPPQEQLEDSDSDEFEIIDKSNL